MVINVQEDHTEFESFTVCSIDSLIVTKTGIACKYI